MRVRSNLQKPDQATRHHQKDPPYKSVVDMASPSKFPVESRASPSVMQATGSGIFVAERALRRDIPDAMEVEPAWLKVTKSQSSFVNRHTVVQRDQFTKTMASPEAPEFLTVPEVCCLEFSRE